MLRHLYASILMTVILTLATTSYAQEFTPPMPTPIQERMEGVITQILEEKQIQPPGLNQKQLYQKLEIYITQGSRRGETITIENGNIPVSNVKKYQVRDNVIFTATKDFEGNDMYYINDYVRRAPLFWLFIIFVALTIIIGRKRGIASIFGMAFSFLVIFLFVLPQISNGQDPILIAIIASLIIIPVTFYLSHGFNRKTTMSVIGTMIALLVTGILATIFVDAAKLTGFSSEEAGFLESIKQGSINIRGLLLAGIIIGLLGILDDITISQAAIVEQLIDTSPRLSFKELYARGMDVGKDHIASVVNTLVLVYTGAALPLLLLFINNPAPFSEVINYEMIAEEIVRTLVASIGLILAVPITTLLAAYFSKKKLRSI